MKIGILMCFIARCEKCGKEARIKVEGPPYFERWKYEGDGCSIVGWQIPNCDENTYASVRCSDCRIETAPIIDGNSEPTMCPECRNTGRTLAQLSGASTCPRCGRSQKAG